jgi:hypothetical protein
LLLFNFELFIFLSQNEADHPLQERRKEMIIIPRKIFLTKGEGKHKEQLSSFELALRNAKIANLNLVRVSSIFPRDAGCFPETKDSNI